MHLYPLLRLGSRFIVLVVYALFFKVSNDAIMRLNGNGVIFIFSYIIFQVRQHEPQVLASNPHWMELLEIYDATKKMLPEEYLRSVINDSGVAYASKSSQPLVNGVKKRTMDFMGVHVSYPQYARLRSIQKEVIKMDQMIRRMVR